MKFVDAALARRMEAAEDEAQLAVAHILRQRRPEIGADSLPIAGGHAVFAGLNSPVGRAIGLGLTAPVTAEEVDQVETFYRSHGAPAQFDVTPLTDESLLKILHDRGYVTTELNNVLARRLDPQEHLNDEVPGIDFRPCPPDQAALWTHTMLRGFFADTPIPEGADSAIPAGWDDLLWPMAVAPHTIPMLAWCDGEPVAAAGGLILPDWRLLTLGGTSTLKEHRGGGIQTAIIGRRLNLGIAAGCDLAVVVTRGGTPSQRNVERLGFSLAYSKPTLVQSKK